MKGERKEFNQTINGESIVNIEREKYRRILSNGNFSIYGALRFILRKQMLK